MDSPASLAQSRLPFAAYAAPLAVFAIALLARLVGLHHTPYVDELNHVMAAHSLLERGTWELTTGGEPYTRARLFTLFVAALFRVFGESLAVARIPAVLAGAALVTALFVWVRTVAGRGAAWVAAMLFCFQPASLYLSGLVRFYTIQTLCFFVAATLVYRLVTDRALPRSRATRLSVAAALLFLLALHFQVITIVGIASVVAWAAADRAHAMLTRSQLRSAIIALVIAAAIAAIAMHRGAFAAPLAMFSYVDDWAVSNRDNVRFYHDLFLDQYPTLWTLFPLLAILALSRCGRAALCCLAPFVVVFVVHSLAAWKAERYLFSVMPMFFAVVGIGIAEGARLVRPSVVGAIEWLSGKPLAARPRSLALVLTTALIAGFAAIGNGATSYAYKMLRESDAEWQLALLYRGQPDWDLAHAVLAPEATSATIVISAAEMKALYYLHRTDVMIGVGLLGDPRAPGPEYSMFAKLARPVVSTSASLAQLRACFPRGLIVAEHGQWRTPWGIPPAVANYIDSTMTPLTLPVASRLVAYRWTERAADSTVNCTEIHARVHR